MRALISQGLHSYAEHARRAERQNFKNVSLHVCDQGTKKAKFSRRQYSRLLLRCIYSNVWPASTDNSACLDSRNYATPYVRSGDQVLFQYSRICMYICTHTRESPYT